LVKVYKTTLTPDQSKVDASKGVEATEKIKETSRSTKSSSFFEDVQRPKFPCFQTPFRAF
jgi:hypothetical protein